MTRKVKFWGALGALGFLLVAGYWVFAAKATPNVQLRASFRSLTDPAFPPDTPGFYADKILNDANGPYGTTDNGSISVWLTSDAGNLVFDIQHHSGRGALFVFPDSATPCGYLPDTAGVYPELTDDPVDYVSVRTYNNSGFTGPKLNFLTMPVGIVQQVRLWVWMCTAQIHGYRINYNEPDPARDAGIVEVTAVDTSGDGKPDRWEIRPVAGTNGLAWILVNPSGRSKGACHFGSFPMPFTLILERR